ncbi:hypothetical protein [Saccharopolyspora tripterygii]
MEDRRGADDENVPRGGGPVDASGERTAWTLWLWLAGVAVVLCTAGAVLLFLWLPEMTWVAWVLAILAVIAAADLCWLAQRGRG